MKLWLRTAGSRTWAELFTAIKSVSGLEAICAQVEAQFIAESECVVMLQLFARHVCNFIVTTSMQLFTLAMPVGHGGSTREIPSDASVGDNQGFPPVL